MTPDLEILFRWIFWWWIFLGLIFLPGVCVIGSVICWVKREWKRS